MSLFPRMITALSLLASTQVFAANPIDTEAYLQAFHANPKAVMNEKLANRDHFGFVLPEEQGLWPEDEAEAELQFQKKMEIRSKLCGVGVNEPCNKPKVKLNTYADITPLEELTKLLYTPNIVRNLSEMDKQKLQLHVLSPSPWSESYWPVHMGGAARRYADPGFPESKVWIENYSHYLANPSSSVPMNQKSPAEKYDVLIGDGSYSLTRAMWMEGKNGYYDPRGKVPTWVGYCHGWAPASFMYQQPVKAVEVVNPSGQRIRFTPTDIKALASLSWGEAPPTVGFIGDKCKKDKVAQDENGRILDPICFDVNPGAWHIALVNQIGIQKRSMVMDSTFNREVWNFPIFGYRYKYFNPQTLQETPTMAGAVIPRSQFTIDKFKKYRSPRATQIVGIALDIGYAAELAPTTAEGPRETKHKVIRFLYDLELNANGEIIGGEWYSNHHPDFVWNPFPTDKFPDRRPLSAPERTYLNTKPALPMWDGKGPIGPELMEMGPRASKISQPLHVIVEKLVEMSVEKKP